MHTQRRRAVGLMAAATAAVGLTIATPSPGHGVATGDAGGARVAPAATPSSVAASTTGTRFLTSASRNGRYFLDQHGHPMMLRGDTVWGLLINAGAVTGSWQKDIDRYVAARASEGFNTIYVAALGYPIPPADDTSGATSDGVSPWVGGTATDPGPHVGTLNPAYWQRVDFLLKAARAAGLTVMLDIVHADNIGGRGNDQGALYPHGHYATDQQMKTYGTMLGRRYKSYPDLVWMIGGDYFGAPESDAKIALTLKAIRAAGAKQMMSVEYFDHSTSRFSTLGRTFASWSVAYTYAPTYTQCEAAWKSRPPIPEVWTDGYYDENSGFDNALLYRQEQGWALTSGSQGSMYAEEGLWDWNAGSLAMAQHPDSVAWGVIHVWRAVSRLPEWNRLVPDISSTRLLTGPRGTKITSNDAYSSPTNDYITGSITPDGRLALIYLPRGGTAHLTWRNMRASARTARWLDPTTGGFRSVSPGRTSYRTPGNNAAGAPDWYLVLRAS